MNQAVRSPVYQQLHGTLRSLIREGDYAEGDQFLTEREIARRFEVSRVTASKALSRLVSDGVLEIRKGAGTFIRGGVLDYDLRQLVSFTEKARAAGKKPKTKVLEFHETTAAELSKELRAGLKVDRDDKLFYVERIRLADDTPVIYERRWVVAEHCPKLTRTDLRNSLYSVWTEKFGLEIIGADETIRAINLSSKQAELLDVLPQTAGLLVLSTGLITNDQPLWWEETSYRTDIYEFRNRLGGIKSSRPAVGQFTAR